MAALVVGVVLDGGGEERVDEGGLAEAGLASNLGSSRRVSMASPARTRYTRHSARGSTREGGGRALLTIIVNAAPLLATILCRWFGRLAMPMGEALSAVAGAMAAVMSDGKRSTRDEGIKRSTAKSAAGAIGDLGRGEVSRRRRGGGLQSSAQDAGMETGGGSCASGEFGWQIYQTTTPTIGKRGAGCGLRAAGARAACRRARSTSAAARPAHTTLKIEWVGSPLSTFPSRPKQPRSGPRQDRQKRAMPGPGTVGG